MSFTANTAFEALLTNNQRNSLVNVTGRYQESSTDADCSAGTLCVTAGKLPCEGMPSGTYNKAAFYMNAATSSANVATPIYAANTYELPFVKTASGQLVHIGTETLHEGIYAGRNGTFTRIVFDGEHMYRFGAGNLSTAISTNTYFTINNGQLVPVAAAPTDNGKVYFKLDSTGTFTEGASVGSTYYDVVACFVAA